MGGITRGQRVGRYELVQVLGEGGMGTVWLAHPYDAPDLLYAVKTVSAEYASDNRVCTMFVKEATLAAAIDHPNVVRLYDVGLHDDVPFFVMEWIDGYSLREVARRVAETGERVPPGVALRIASDLCAGLHAAHELLSDDGQPLGLVHRDVSPHNVLVTREGVAKLIDFGVAKARDLATGAEHSVYGGLKGKVRYMAPEQALDDRIDRRADLFSVGAIVYQLLTGRAPFEGPNEVAVINSLLSTNPVFVPDTLPEPVQWILRRALARRPEGRFADAAEMRDAVEAALVELDEPDTHADVAQCLAWFDPRSSSGDDASSPAAQLPAGDTEPGMQLRSSGSQPPPPLAFETPTPIPARVPTLAENGEIVVHRRVHASNAGSWRFILLAAGFVGVLGASAALLARDGGPASARRPSVREATAALENAPLPAPTTTVLLLPSEVPTNTPIIDIGDLDEHGPRAASRPRPVRHAPARPAAPSASPARAASSKAGDLAGPIKVWK